MGTWFTEILTSFIDSKIILNYPILFHSLFPLFLFHFSSSFLLFLLSPRFFSSSILHSLFLSPFSLSPIIFSLFSFSLFHDFVFFLLSSFRFSIFFSVFPLYVSLSLLLRLLPGSILRLSIFYYFSTSYFLSFSIYTPLFLLSLLHQLHPDLYSDLFILLPILSPLYLEFLIIFFFLLFFHLHFSFSFFSLQTFPIDFLFFFSSFSSTLVAS